MKRVLVGGFHHESNSLSRIISVKKDFRILRGKEITENIVANSSLSGIVSTLKSNGIEVVPTLHMRGVPNGEIELAYFETVRDEFLEMAKHEKGHIDAITLALHGSMRIETLGDAEGHILEELRKIYPDTPIFVALDMHASISESMCRYADGMVGYKTAPHIDCTETGILAAEMTLHTLKTGVLPKKSTIRIPMIVAGEKSGTDVEPMASLIGELEKVEKNEEILAASYLLGFPWADNADNAISVHVVAKNSQEVADRIAAELALKFWSLREQFVFVTEAYDIKTSLDKAFAYVGNGNTPVYLSDSGDNPTAGATSDNTELLLHLVDDRRTAELAKPIIYAGFYDPRALSVCRNNIGKKISLEIGGVFDPDFQSVKLEGTVKNFVSNFVYAGIPGDVAVFSVSGIDIILSENHIGYTEPRLMTTLGLDPEHAEIVVCKLGYLTPGHSALANKSILVLTKGATNQELESIPYKNIMRPVFPVDKNIDYRTEDYKIG